MVELKYKMDAEFYDEELMCGHLVTRKVKEIWAVELDILKEFIRICDEYGLQYYAIGGTLLGAVRHKGFIPWDDDIDIVMPRKDYNKLLQVGKLEFCEPYFLQTPESEYKFWRSHIQIRNSNTTGAILIDKSHNINRGIFIDIFPLDNIPDESRKRKRIAKKLRRIKFFGDALYCLTGSDWSNINMVRKIGKIIMHLFDSDKVYKKIYYYYNNVSCKMDCTDGSQLAHLALGYREKTVWNRESFKECIEMPFHDIMIKVPVGYTEILAKHYGSDFMDIPSKIEPSTHGSVIFDTNTSYKVFFDKE